MRTLPSGQGWTILVLMYGYGLVACLCAVYYFSTIRLLHLFVQTKRKRLMVTSTSTLGLILHAVSAVASFAWPIYVMYGSFTTDGDVAFFSIAYSIVPILALSVVAEANTSTSKTVEAKAPPST